jgi:exopolysaccharide biosynthesis polyprenyl glycosylphosphotransferase
MRIDTVVNGEALLARPHLRRYSLRSQRAFLMAWTVFTDSLALAASFALAYWIRFDVQITVAPEVAAPGDEYRALTALLIALWLGVFVAFNLYDMEGRAAGTVESSRTFHACTTATMLVIVTTFAFRGIVVSRMWLVSAWLLSFALVAANRFACRRLVYALRRRGYLLAPAVIVGLNQEAMTLANHLSDWQASGVVTCGFLSSRVEPAYAPVELPLLGSVRDIRTVVKRYGVEDVIVAITAIDRDELLRLSEEVDSLPVHLRLSSGLYEMLTTRVSVRTLGTVPLMSLQKNRLSREEVLVKRLLDSAVALSGLFLAFPVLLAIGVIVKWDSPGPVFYRRRVLGVSGRQFDAFKFRTMYVDGDDMLRDLPQIGEELKTNHKVKEDPRVTRAGRWLRKYSLDELPQLVNVLRGEMSLVGPRMITPGEAAKYGRQRMNLLTVKPGITGLWQVSGRSDLTYEERVRIDMYYIRNYSVWLDLQILFVQTLPAVMRGRGAY